MMVKKSYSEITDFVMAKSNIIRPKKNGKTLTTATTEVSVMFATAIAPLIMGIRAIPIIRKTTPLTKEVKLNSIHIIEAVN